MIVLGINAYGHNPSACLVRDGRLLSFCQEERLNRFKGSFGMFPSRAILWCLQTNRLKMEDVDKLAFSWGCHKYPGRMLKHLAKVKLSLIGKEPYICKSSIDVTSNTSSVIEYLYEYNPNVVKSGIRDNLRSFGHKGPIPGIEFVEHHLSHAYQAYYQSPFEDAVILVADGSGEENTVSGYSMKDGELKKLFGCDVPQSLGWFYGGFTGYLGFHPNRDEGKLMGLAALGEERKDRNPWIERLDRVIRVTDDGFEIDPFYFKFGGNEHHARFTDHLVNYITSFDEELVPVGVGEKAVNSDGVEINRYLLDDYVDIAYAVQSRLEQVMSVLVKRLINETGLKNLCLAGGIAMNCKANGHLLEESGIENIFVHPASTDDGSAAGGAFFVAKQNGDDVRNILRHVQLGPSFTNDEVEKILKDCHIQYSKPDDICEEVAGLLAQEKIVGWFRGGVEMGARALGGRSIVACPENPQMKDQVNRQVKFREPWRPYCPSLTSESKGDYFVNPVDLPYMIVSRKATDELKQHAAATVHVDGTVRPQTVERDVLPEWHHLIECMKKHSGHPLVLNTSFNVRGEPIVCTPYDGIRCFYSTGIDALAIEDCLIVKK